MDFKKLSTKDKALAINLDNTIYGSFAEIGAGQEVAANFFKVGGASGTIAKTMSAYDMKFSDAIYGKAERYVCEPRLNKMLDKEFQLMHERLPHRAHNTRFFSFADTVEALNYRKTNQGHGWMGIRFQLTPQSPPNECIIHVLMHDNESIWQQHALGEVGVNLIYACFHLHKRPEKFLYSLVEGLSSGRIEIDMFKLSGPDFEDVDNRLLSLKLVKSGMTKAAIFKPDGRVLQPSQALYKKNVLALRSRFRPVTHVNIDMIKTGLEQFKKETDVTEDKIIVLSELTLHDLRGEGDVIDDRDFLSRVDILCSLGQTVMISDYPEYYKLVEYISRMTKGYKIGIILGIRSLSKILDERYYENLEGGILESYGRLFGKNVKLLVYPSHNLETNHLDTCDNIDLPFQVFSLFRYLYDNNKLADIENVNTDLLDIVSDNVLKLIKSGESGWEKMVPELVAEAIKENGLFEYPKQKVSE